MGGSRAWKVPGKAERGPSAEWVLEAEPAGEPGVVEQGTAGRPAGRAQIVRGFDSGADVSAEFSKGHPGVYPPNEIELVRRGGYKAGGRPGWLLGRSSARLGESRGLNGQGAANNGPKNRDFLAGGLPFEAK